MDTSTTSNSKMPIRKLIVTGLSTAITAAVVYVSTKLGLNLSHAKIQTEVYAIVPSAVGLISGYLAKDARVISFEGQVSKVVGKPVTLQSLLDSEATTQSVQDAMNKMILNNVLAKLESTDNPLPSQVESTQVSDPSTTDTVDKNTIQTVEPQSSGNIVQSGPINASQVPPESSQDQTEAIILGEEQIPPTPMTQV
jgi:hypothetical protein